MKKDFDRILAIAIITSFLAAQFPLAAQDRGMPRPPVPEPARISAPQASLRISRLVVPGKETVLDLDGVRLVVPPGAVARSTTVSITRLAGVASLDEGMSNVTQGSTGYRFEPHGTVFLKPVRITMGFDRRIADSPTALSNLYTYFHDDTLGRWERLQREDLDRNAATITSMSHHFTDMINATLKLPEGPQPIQYDVNSIKKLEAANPGEGVPLPDGPQPGPFGAASFSIPLRLPPGRGGASPQLALRYSSDAGESWLGKGFDIESPAVTIDTRFGLPRYDGTDRYTLNGEELLPIGTDNDGSLLFQPRTEKSFARIRWYRASGAGAGDDFWQVTEKNGTVSEFGRTAAQAWLGPDRANRARTFTWYLSRKTDSFGNTISYSYFNDQAVSAPGNVPNNYTYLSDIFYTGFQKTGDPGAFHVQFTLEGADRDDRRLDSRGTFPSKLARRLQQVNVFYRNTLVRAWQFSYAANEFGQSLLASFSETDGGASAQFYRYSFDYYALPQHLDQGTFQGYDAFGLEEIWPLQSSAPFKGLSTTNTTSVGADLYVGLEFSIWLPFIGKVAGASFGIRGGLQSSTGASAGTLLDANGDGLPDLVWKNGGSLVSYLNTGSGFDTSRVFTLPGLPGNMDAEQGNMFSFGVSAGLLGASGAVTWQESWTQGRSAFIDVNGDGLVDYVSSGSGTFGLNSGSSLLTTDWSQVSSVSGGAQGALGDDTYNKTYYLEEPFRAWKAYRSGTVIVDQEASLLDPTSKSAVSLLTDPPGGQPVPAPLRLVFPASTVSSTGQQYDLSAGQRIYFHVDAGSPTSSDQEASQRTRWNVKIRYSSIRLFEGLQDGAMFVPPLTLDPSSWDFRLSAIYYPQSSKGTITMYTLRANWQSLGADALALVYAALIDHGYFVPRRIPKDWFIAVLNAAAGGYPITLSPPQVTTKDGKTYVATTISPSQAILEGFIYEPETATFIRTGAAAIPTLDQASTTSDLVLTRYLNVLSFDQKQDLARVRTVDGASYTPVQAFADSSFGYELAGPQRVLGALVTDAGVPGNLLPDKGLLLETTYLPSGAPLERLWLRQDTGLSWTTLARESLAPETMGQVTLEPGAASTIMNQDSIAVTLSDHGVRRTLTFTGKGLVQQLPDSLYSGAVSARILAGQVFSAQAFSVIPAASWAAMTANSDPQNPTFQALQPCYVQGPDGDYSLADASTYTDGQLQAAVLALQAAAPPAGSIFTSFPMDSTTQRLLLLTPVQMDALTAVVPPSQQATLSACFSQFTSTGDGKTWYFQNPALISIAQDLVLSAMQRYKRDVDLFPYYTDDPSSNVWNLKGGVASDQAASDTVRSMMDACGIQAWTTLDRSIRYTSAQSLPVIAQTSLPNGAVEDPIVPTGSTNPAPGEPVGVVMVPGFDSLTGNTVVTPHYFHTFDSSTDFSSQDLVVFPTDSNGPLYHGDAAMSGGAYGWYYGNWSGYYAWDKSLIGVNSNTGDSGNSKPPYSATMSPNRSSDGTTPITTSGRDYPVAVSTSAWIGNVSSYSDVTMNADLSTTTTEYRFAAFISGDEVAIGRNGGDSYYRIPRGTGSGGGSLPFIRSSHTSATDLNGGVSFGVVGGSASRNSSSSWQYQGIMDLNGDRFPDLVSFSDSSGDSSSFTVVEGNGRGFGKTDTFTLPGGGHLARYDTTSYGFGASMSGSSGGINLSDDSKGRPRTITLLKPEPVSSGFGGNVGLNGTFGSSVQSEGFYDMNGDGLPDYVSRSNAGDYSVALNRGDGTFASAIDWGSGISVLAFPDGLPGDLKNRTDGLSFSGTGSFGASGGLSAGAGGFSVGVSGGFTATVSQTYSALADVNGDGLPDQVVKLKTEPFFRVRYNLGDHFSSETRLYRPAWGFAASGYRDSIQQDLRVLVNGLNGLSIPGGFSIPGLQSLPNQENNPLSAALDPFSMDDDLEYSTGASFNLGANISISFSFWLLTLTIAPGINGSVASTSASLKFTDVDGDGLPDHVLKLPMENFLRVKRNLSGTVGLLKKVNAPQGGTYELGYVKVGNTPDMPQSRWVLNSLTRNDGVATTAGAPTDRGLHSYTETYAYVNGYYDRTERMFYGFAEVTATRSNGAVSTTRYLNRDYYTRGMTAGSELTGPDAGGQIVLYQQSSTQVQKTLQRSVRKASAEAVDIFFPNVASESTRQYQAGTSTYVETTRSYAYDAYGNVVDLYDNGTTGDPAQKVHARIAYDLNIPGADYQKQSPSGIRVEGSTGALMRLRQGTYGASGELLRLDQYESAVTQRSYTLAYDQYGNLASIADPRGQTLGWTYDDQVHTYATQIRSLNSSMGSPEYDSSVEWDFALGKKAAEVDQNGQRMSYAYDIFGRLIEVRSPYDTGSMPAVSYQYNLSSFPWTAVTLNKLLYDPADSQTMQTVIAMDGLGRVLQTAKQGEQRDSLGARTEGWNLSGAIAYDGNGRVAQEGQPQFASGSALPALAAMKNPTTKSYDAQDRVVQQVLPDNATITSSYLVGGSGMQLVQRTVDPLGNAEERQTDGRGNITKVTRLDGTGKVLMSATYGYDGLSQILSAVDSRGNAVAVVYDLLGRRTSLQSPDTGIETRSYDESGNLSQKTTSVLRGKGEAIDYQYDGLNRLTAIIYPESAPVRYTYGAPGAANNGAGRLVQRVDQSGTVSYQYGKLGETTQMSRSITRLTPLESPVSATFSYLSDYLGRLQQITYPDAEVVSYGYDFGGQVRTVTGVHWGQSTQYVRDIGYDEYGQRTYIEYGNGVRTSYAYDPARRWLNSISTQTQYGSVMQAMSYRFDLVGNILGYTNASATYSTSQSYSYDGLYQLIGAQGTSSSHPSGFDEWASTYQQSFSYDEIGNMTGKTSAVATNPARSVGDELNYALSYSYYAGKGHQAEVIGKLYYRYDANGNTIEEREGGHGTGVVLGGTVSRSGNLRMTDRGFGLVLQDAGSPAPSVYTRYYVWDEENRLVRTVDGSLTVDYRYGADGQRAVKYSSRGESLYFDSMWQAQTDYPSLRQSKHVYVGSTRVATRLNIQGQLDVGYETVNTYYYHPDHLGSSQLVSDSQGKEYERVEYTPYGESWIEKSADSRELLPFKFTGKEQDSETGLYYYGARYLNPRTSRWVSADPALGDYLPLAPASDQTTEVNRNIPGEGGVFNLGNFAVYNYAINNPLRYNDPNGRDVFSPGKDEPNPLQYRVTDGSIAALPTEGPCYMAALQGIAETYANKTMTARDKIDSVKALTTARAGGGTPAMDKEFSVNDSKAVIVDALKRLGVDTSKLVITVARPSDANYADVRASATASLRHVGVEGGTDANHWQQGDAKGRFVWDPISGTDDRGRKNYPDETRYVIIKEREN